MSPIRRFFSQKLNYALILLWIALIAYSSIGFAIG
jgi:hypothetical protein